MNEDHKNALERSLHDTCEELDAEDVFPYLISKGIITMRQVEEISAITRKDTRNMRLIAIIQTAGPLAFKEFINALYKHKKDYLAEKILLHLPSSSSQQIELPEVNTTQPLSTPSISPQPSAEDWQQKLETAQQSLKKSYLTRFRKVYPFSFPFTFDIENTWVSLALKDDVKNSHATEDHAKLLQKAFERAKMLIIEGNPATGKTSLMRRLAYEWANRKQELLHYDLVLYAEFREVREQTFERIADLVLCYSKNYLTEEEYENLKKLMNNNEPFCKEYRILVLLDGYDESSLEEQCSELSLYTTKKTINNQLLFTTVITTRKGYLSNLRGREGRFVFAEVLGFTTKQQKEKYVHNHFLSSETDNKHNFAAVYYLLNNNQNLSKLAETPLFLTFICLVHERIIDGTLLELYCNIIWWLIDRHQQDFPERDIPALFGFQSACNDKFETIQDHYLHFPQLHCLGNMALRNLEKDIFEPSDYKKFNLQPIIEHVGLLRKEKKYDKSFKLVSLFFYPHRTIQEFLAACYCFCSNDPASECLIPNSSLDSSTMKEFEKFLLRITLSNTMPIRTEKRKYYFERIADIKLDFAFDAFNTSAGYNSKLLNWFLSQCTNVLNIQLIGKLISARQEMNVLNHKYVHDKTDSTSELSSPALFSFSHLTKLHSLTFKGCIFETNIQLCFINCPSLKNLKFYTCEMKSSTNLDIALLQATDTVEFVHCSFEVNSHLFITNCPSLKNLIFHTCKLKRGTNLSIASLQAIDIVAFDHCAFETSSQMSFTNCPSLKKLTFHTWDKKSSINLSIASLQATDTVEFDHCTFEANSQMSFTNCPSLKNLTFHTCEMKRNTIVGIARLPAIDIVQFDYCNIDLTAWQSITDDIRDSSVKYLKLTFGADFNKVFLIHLQKCNNIEKTDITIENNRFSQNDMFSFSDLMNINSLTFDKCTFETNSLMSFISCVSVSELILKNCIFEANLQLSFINCSSLKELVLYKCTITANTQLSFIKCSSLKNLIFRECEMKSSTNLGIATLLALDNMEFNQCKLDLATWQSIADQISNSSVQHLKLSAEIVEGTYPEFLYHLQNCKNVEIIINDKIYKNKQFCELL